ncbi:MAG: helix-turn-helix domain-containing protein [Oscillospiraceae bacterium]|nr:helix-turn-helix domain-containing protein [Oscillospiraceae bacterium]
MSKTEIVANNMRELRKDWNFRQSDIASFLGVDTSLISRAESAERALSVDLLEKLGDLYGVSLADLENVKGAEIPYKCAYRAENISREDMETICAINKIAKNAIFLEKLLGGSEQ